MDVVAMSYSDFGYLVTKSYNVLYSNTGSAAVSAGNNINVVAPLKTEQTHGIFQTL